MMSDIEKRFGPRPENVSSMNLEENMEAQKFVRECFYEFAKAIDPLIVDGPQKTVGINQLQASMQWMLSALESELKE